jgi:hypothetical protein
MEEEARGAFTSIPTLDYALLEGSREEFMSQLRHIATNVGFMYLRGTEARIPAALVQKMKVGALLEGVLTVNCLHHLMPDTVCQSQRETPPRLLHVRPHLVFFP